MHVYLNVKGLVAEKRSEELLGRKVYVVLGEFCVGTGSINNEYSFQSHTRAKDSNCKYKNNKNQMETSNISKEFQTYSLGMWL